MDNKEAYLYRNFMSQTKTAARVDTATLNKMMEIAKTPALQANRLETVGVALGTGIATGQVNNLIHDNQIRKDELERERDEMRDMKLAEMRQTLGVIKEKVKRKEKDGVGLTVDAPKPITPPPSPVSPDGDLEKIAEPAVAKTSSVWDYLPNPKEVVKADYQGTKGFKDSFDKLTASNKKVLDIAASYRQDEQAVNAAKALLTDPEHLKAHALKTYADIGGSQEAGTMADILLKRPAEALTNYADIGKMYASTLLERISSAESKAPNGILPKKSLDEIVKGVSQDIKREQAIYKPFVDATLKHEKLVALKELYNTTRADSLATAQAIKDAEKLHMRKSMIEAGVSHAGNVAQGLSGVLGYGKWRRGALGEVSAINRALEAEKLIKARNLKLALGAGVFGAAALGAGALYNQMTDRVAPAISLTGGIDINKRLSALRERRTGSPLSPIQEPALLAPPSAHTDSTEPVEWGKAATAAGIVDTIKNSLPKVKSEVKKISGSMKNDAKKVFSDTEGWYDKLDKTPEGATADPNHVHWGKKVGLALGGIAAAYGAYRGVKAVGVKNVAETLLPRETGKLRDLVHSLRGGMREAPSQPWSTKKKVALGASALGAGYLYSKSAPPPEEDGVIKQGSEATMLLSELVKGISSERQAINAKKAIEAGKLKAMGTGVLAGLASVPLVRGVTDTVSNYQQRQIQNQMLGLQNMQAMQNMQYGMGQMGMMNGYTNPVAMQQGKLY